MKAGKNKELDNMLINLNQNPEPPNYAAAKNHRKRYSLRAEPLTLLGIEEYSKFGPGVKLYFAMLKYLAALFLLLSIAVLPSMIVNFHGNGLSLYGNSWEQTFLRLSLSNQESLDLASDELSLEEQMARVRNVKFNQFIVIFNDIFCSVIILAFLVLWRIKSKSVVSELISKNAPPSYHTLLVDLPQHFDDERLMEHFSQFGAVQQIQYVRNYGDFLLDLKDLLKLIEDYSQQLNLPKKNILYDEIGERYDKIKRYYRSINEQGGGNPFPKIKAFVCFEDHQLAQRVHGLYKYNMNNMNLSMDGNAMKVRKCLVEPLSIIWENFHLKDHSQYLRSCLFCTIVGFLLLLTLFGIFVLSMHANGMTKDGQSFSIATAQLNITFAEAQKSNDTAVIKSFCSSLTYKTFQWRYYQLCADFFKRFEQHWIYVGTLSFVVAIVTIILIKIVFAMTELRRFRTLPQKRRFMILSILITYLVSSSLLALLIRAEIKWDGGSFSLVKWTQNQFPELSVKNNLDVYNEMTRKWYMEIGKLLLANYFLTLNIFPWLYVIEEWVMQLVRLLWAKQARTQKIMNKRILDCEFYWEFYYSVQLNSIYFCLFFSMAMPVFYFLAFLSIISLLITNKIIFCYFTRQPQAYDHKLNTFISHAISVSLVLHQFASLYALSVNQIFPSSEPELISFMGCKIIYLLFACLLIIALLHLKRISQIVEKRIFRKRENLMITEEINSTFGAEKNERKMRASRSSPSKKKTTYLSSYKMQDNPYYNSISYTLLILEQVISDKPMEHFPEISFKSEMERIHCTSLNAPLGSKFIDFPSSDRNLSF